MHAGSVSQRSGPDGPARRLEIVDREGSAVVSFSSGSGDVESWVGGRIGARRLVRNRQIHSDRMVEADPDRRQDADALWSADPEHALLVLTADCVPVLLASRTRLAAVHAGWRGLAAGIVSRVAEKLSRDSDSVTAWIGPAIGACCYEVDHDVAAAVARTASGRVVLPAAGRPAPRPRLDLAAAAREQLLCAGVTDVRVLRRCTRCADGEGWYSYRRDGRGGGHNLALIWRWS